MIRITQGQKDYLIAKGYLKLERGRYVGLSICNKEHGKGKSKTYYVVDFMKRWLKGIL